MEPPVQENQQEFFPDFVRPSERKPEPRVPGIGRTHKPILFTTTIEQILFTAIVSILVLCAVYFLGILRGKSLSAVPTSAPVRVIEAPNPKAAIPSAAVVRQAAAAHLLVTRSNAAVLPPAPVLQVQAPQAAVRRSAPAAQPPVVNPGQRLYTIQIVTHKKRAFAESELAAVGKAGFTGKIVESDGYFIVCVGQYAAKDDAKKDLGFLKAKYPDCFLRRL